MNNVYKLNSHADILGEACDWLARLERGLDQEEESALYDWLAISPLHRETLIETATLWDKMDSLSRLAGLFPKTMPRKNERTRVVLAIAASVLLTMALGLFMTHSPDKSTRQNNIVALSPDYHQIFETAVGEHSLIHLPDGSELTLNTNSRVRVRFSDNFRSLILERGEVYVKVFHEKRPLDVQAGNKIIHAVGTEFNVEIKDEHRIELIVTEGKVLVGVLQVKSAIPKQSNTAPLRQKLELPVTAGERVLLSEENEAIEEIATEEIDVKLSWRGGNLVFRGESLEEALTEIERYTPVEFVIMDENLKTVRIAGLFKAGDVDGLLTALRQNFNISYERLSDRKIVLTDK